MYIYYVYTIHRSRQNWIRMFIISDILIEKGTNMILKYKNKRPMGHIAHLRKQFKSINTYDYIITLIKRKKTLHDNLLFFHLNPHPRMLCAKIG